MRMTGRARWRMRAENLLFLVLFLTAVGLAAWLSTRYHLQADWTASGRNSLAPESVALLERLEGPVRITAYAREDEILRGRIRDLVDRYRRHEPDITLETVNPDEVPDRVRELGITMDGELVVRYQGRTEHVRTHTEQALSNALQRLARAGERWLVFLTGHGERAPLGEANHDLGGWGRQLEQRGFNVSTLNLAEAGEVPDNTSVLVVAGPQVSLLPGEVELLREYLAVGGNLLWLHDPGALHGLAPLAEALGVELGPGTVVDPTAQLFGVDNPAVVVVTEYGLHPVTEAFDLVTVLPQATPVVEAPGDGGWEATPLLLGAPQAWSETGPLEGEVRFEPEADLEGPLDLALALERPSPLADSGELPEGAPEELAPPAEPPPQRVVVVGDGDFLSNAFLGSGGNLELGFNMVNWLASDEALLDIPMRSAPDTRLDLSPTTTLVIGGGFLAALPLALLAMGVAVWMRRRRR